MLPAGCAETTRIRKRARKLEIRLPGMGESTLRISRTSEVARKVSLPGSKASSHGKSAIHGIIELKMICSRRLRWLKRAAS